MRRSLVLPPALALAAAAPLVLAPPERTPGEVGPLPGAVAPKPTVVKRRVYRRPRVRSRERFVPYATPSIAQAKMIIGVEAARWGASAARLSCRVNGESGYHWNAVNGQYAGLGQFAHETFYRGYASIGTRKVVRVIRRVRRPRSVVKTVYSDGRVVRSRGRRYRQVRTRVYVGWLPAHYVERTHGWAQVRIMARAMVGLGAVGDSEWEVRC